MPLRVRRWSSLVFAAMTAGVPAMPLPAAPLGVTPPQHTHRPKETL